MRGQGKPAAVQAAVLLCTVLLLAGVCFTAWLRSAAYYRACPDSVSGSRGAASVSGKYGSCGFPAETHKNPKIFLIGFSGLDWSAVNRQRTPNIWKYLGTGAGANLVVKTEGETTCPDGGWLSLNTGARTLGAGGTGGVCAPLPNDGRISGWKTLADVNSRTGYDPKFGRLNDIFARKNMRVAAIGGGARLAAADSRGNFSGTFIPTDAPSAGGTVSEAGLKTALRQLKDEQAVIVDLGALRAREAKLGTHSPSGSPLRSAFIPPDTADSSLLAQVRELDRRIGRTLAEIPRGSAVLMFSVAEADTKSARPQFFAMRTAEGKQGTAHTNSTRQTGVVQLTDILPTVSELLGGEKLSGVNGAPVRVHPRYAPPARQTEILRGDLRRALAVRSCVGIFYISFAVLSILGSAFAGLCLYRGRSRRALAIFLPGVAALPAASFLVNLFPWWNCAAPVEMFFFSVFFLSLLLGILSFAARSPLPVACLGFAVPGIDALFGSGLHFSSVLGDQPQSGGRFYGLSNVPFAVFGVSAVMLAGYGLYLLRKNNASVFTRGLFCATFLALCLFVDGSPQVGADFGGPPTLTVAFLLLFFIHWGKKLNLFSVLSFAACALAVMFLTSFPDWLRPVQMQSHLGKFFGSVLAGNALPVILRKARFVFEMPLIAWIALAAGLCVIAFAWWKNRERLRRILSEDTGQIAAGTLPRETVQAGLAVFALLFSAAAINDSGITIVFFGLIYAIPLWGMPLLRGTPPRHAPGGKTVTEKK